MNRFRFAIGFFVLVIGFVFLWSYGNAIEKKKGGIYKAPLLNNPPTLDPAYVQDIYGVFIAGQLFDGLVQFSPELFVVPAIAENWQVEDQGRSYRFLLRKDAKFHDGSPITSRDVVFSISRLLRADPQPTILPHLLKIKGAKAYHDQLAGDVLGLKMVDNHTLLVELEEPYVPFLVALGMYQAAIVPAAKVAANEKEFARNPVGSGPFKFDSWEENKVLRLVAFKDYYAGAPLLDGIDYIIYPGISIEKVWADFEAGKLHQMPVYGEIRQKLKDRKSLKWIHRPSLSLQFYGINCANPTFSDVDFRAALSKSINREKYVAEVLQGQFEVAKSILPPGLPGHRSFDDLLTYDPKAARAHLERARARHPDLPGEIEIVSNSQSQIAQAEMELVGENLSQLGLKLTPKYIPDWSEFENYLESDSMQIYRYAWFADIPDPDDFLRSLFLSDSQVNYMRFHDQKVDGMLLKAVGIVDPIKRAQMYQNIEESILRSYPIIPLIYLSIDYAFQPSVHGIQMNALGAKNMSLHRVWLSDEASP